jgi:hypothetical protein
MVNFIDFIYVDLLFSSADSSGLGVHHCRLTVEEICPTTLSRYVQLKLTKARGMFSWIFVCCMPLSAIETTMMATQRKLSSITWASGKTITAPCLSVLS